MTVPLQQTRPALPVQQGRPAPGPSQPPAALERPLWPGTRGPSTGTRPRVPGSIRRTTSIDMLRPDGLTGQLHLVGRGRDLVTTADGAARELDTAGMHIVLDFLQDRTISRLRTDPEQPALAGLVGRSARTGFRRAVREALDPRLAGSLLAQLLDDVPVSIIVSGSALMRAEIDWERPQQGPNRPAVVGICAGWQEGGALDTQRRQDGRSTVLLSPSPLAGDPTVPADGGAGAGASAAGAPDELAWHPMEPLPPWGMRRVRRLDVIPAAAVPGSPPEAAYLVDAYQRDSCADPRDAEVVVHEFAVRATVAADGTVLSATATTGVVPGPECPQAEPSAGRVVGQRVGDLRELVGRTFVGTSTCTHLNDTLRTLGDVPRLIAALIG